MSLALSMISTGRRLVADSRAYWARVSPVQIPSTLSDDIAWTSKWINSGKVIDIGCGHSAVLDRLALNGIVGVGVDTNRSALLEVVNSEAHSVIRVQGDASALPVRTGEFDHALMLALLTIIPDRTERMAVISEANRALTLGGLLYISEFLQTPSTETYGERYRKGFRETGEYGTFLVRDSEGRDLYLAHHFSFEELSGDLRQNGFYVEYHMSGKVRTRSGNQIDGINIVARKRSLRPLGGT